MQYDRLIVLMMGGMALVCLSPTVALAQDDAWTTPQAVLQGVPPPPPLPSSSGAVPASAPAAAAPRLSRESGGGWLSCPVPAANCPDQGWKSPLLPRIPCIDDCIDKHWLYKFNPETCFKIHAGAYHWFNYDSDRDNWSYGFDRPGFMIPGTYFYYVIGSLECQPTGSVTLGAYANTRIREETPNRAYIQETAYFQEAYLYAKTSVGTFKAGKQFFRFGLSSSSVIYGDTFWDDSFWGNVPYFNGTKLNSEWGFGWEHEWNWSRLRLPAYAQILLGEDDISGAIGFGDSESSAVYDKEWTAFFRVAPRLNLGSGADIVTGLPVMAKSLTLGLSGMVGNLTNSMGPDETRTAFAADLTLQWCGFKAWAEYALINGTDHETHYATGGPTDEKQTLLVGGSYTHGPLTGRVHYSRGDYSNPGGEDEMLIFGLDIRLTKWVQLQIEYVDWTAQATGGPLLQFEDGLQVVINWNI